MKKHLFTTFIIATLLTGCAPKVVTDMLTNEWPATSPDSVYLFNTHDTLPAGSQTIGKVKVVDNGFSVKGTFDRVLQLAINATAEKGGNGLQITEHRWPDIRSSIHRVWGNILRVPESAMIKQEEPEKKEYSVLENLLPPDEYEDYMRYREAKQQYEYEMKEYAKQVRKAEEIREQMPRNIFRLSVGPTLMTSKYQVDNHIYKSRAGIDILFDYDHIWKSGFGFGINYKHNYTSFDEGIKTRVDYIGPSFVIAPQISKTCRYDVALGFGYGRYKESYGGLSYSEGRFAAMMRIGLEWRIARQLALGPQINMFTMTMKKPEGLELDKNDTYGIQHMGLQVGLRYYF